MSFGILIDMNLSPRWVAVLERSGWRAQHWSSLGDPRAPDSEVMRWALTNEHIVFTHDLHFGTMLALTRARGPSVLQVRAQDVFPDHLDRLVISALKQHESDLGAGALVVVDEHRSRVRILPIGPGS